MAKSFSVNELYKFLLGVKVLDNSKISDFVKNVKIYDSMVKILPLEYTLVSKQSAINGNYENRLSKDYIDLAYIIQHKEELGISNEVIEQITNNYPDYSISIAYKVNNGHVDTMNGEDYKQYVLINKGSRNIS
jgi:predicted nucleotidyltransferase